MLKQSVLLIHSILGMVIFLTGVLQILQKKGGKWHRFTGRVYLHGWLGLLLSGAYLGGLLISVIGVFGYYFSLTGARIGQLKQKPVQLFDKATFVIGTAISILMLYYAMTLYLRGQSSFSIIFAVFGTIFLWTTAQDVSKYIFGRSMRKHQYGRHDWYFEHFTRMFISFIAAVTAFVSIQNLFKNNTLNFLVPTAVGMALINLTQKSYKKKLKISPAEGAPLKQTA